MLGIEVDPGAGAAQDQRTGSLAGRVEPLAIDEATGRIARQFTTARPRRAREQHDQEPSGRQQQPVQQPEGQHADQGDQGDAELDPRRRPHLLQFLDLHQVLGRHEHDRAQHRFGKVMEQPGEEQQGEHDGAGGERPATTATWRRPCR